MNQFGRGRYEADQLYSQALTHYKAGSLAEADAVAQQAIATYPGRGQYYALRGLIALHQADEPLAQAQFEQAAALSPTEQTAHYGLGVVAYNARRYEDAEQHMAMAWNLQPERVEVLYYLAMLAHRRGNNADASAWMQAAQQRIEPRDDRTAREWKRNMQRWNREFDNIVRRERL